MKTTYSFANPSSMLNSRWSQRQSQLISLSGSQSTVSSRTSLKVQINGEHFYTALTTKCMILVDICLAGPSERLLRRNSRQNRPAIPYAKSIEIWTGNARKVFSDGRSGGLAAPNCLSTIDVEWQEQPARSM
jgi:hypothetical protein